MNVWKFVSWVVVIGLLGGCSGGRHTTFLHPEYNFAYVERVAVVPFENLTSDQGAGARGTRLFVSELLATEAFDVVEPGEVSRALGQVGTLRTAELTTEQVTALGKDLGVQGVILGSIDESATLQSGSARENVVTLTLRMVETETGATVWSTTQTEKGRGFWSGLFGTGGKSEGEVARRCAAKAIRTLVQ
jgi:TolB-like protein